VKDSLAQQIEEVLSGPDRLEGLARGGQLRVAAAALARAPSSEITATTVVGAIGLDDVRSIEALIDEICDEFALDASVRFGSGSFSVRFSRRDSPPAPAESSRSKTGSLGEE
jgi:hypothetical protein